MPIILLLLAAKAAHRHHLQRKESDTSGTDRQSDSSGTSNSVRQSTNSKTNNLRHSNNSKRTNKSSRLFAKKHKMSKLERRGDYLLDVKNGRLYLAKEGDIRRNGSGSSGGGGSDGLNFSEGSGRGGSERSSNMSGAIGESSKGRGRGRNIVDLDDSLSDAETSVNLNNNNNHDREALNKEKLSDGGTENGGALSSREISSAIMGHVEHTNGQNHGNIDRDSINEGNINNTGSNMSNLNTGSNLVDLDDTLSDVDTSLETVAMTDVTRSPVDNGSGWGRGVSSANSVNGGNGDGVNGGGDGHNETFRNDIRQEWVDAMFGKHFFPLHSKSGSTADSTGAKGSKDTNGNESQDESWRDPSIKQGIGEAQTGNWVCYGALLDPGIEEDSGGSNGRGGYGSNNYNSGKGEYLRANSSLTQNGSDRIKTPLKDGTISSIKSKTKSTPLLMNNLSFGGSLLNVRSGSNLDCSFSGNENGHSFNGGRGKAKIGATISRIPLGLYVKSISTQSEAYSVGITPGSILVDINGLGLLGETSHRALERMWRYTHANSEMKKPLKLNLYKNGLYQVVLLSDNPLGGIEWGPCGNFGLIQKCHGLAAKCGVRRGCLVLAVDGKSLRSLDHAGCAGVLLDRWDTVNSEGGQIVLTLGYTPATSRSSHFEEKAEKKSNTSGVEIRPRPVEYGTALTETFFACTAPNVSMVEDVEKDEKMTLAELAAYVCAGGRLSPEYDVAAHLDLEETPSRGRRVVSNSFGGCPPLPSLLDAWDPMTSLVRSMCYQACGCCETAFVEMGGLFWREEAPHSTLECLKTLQGIAKRDGAVGVFDANLMQLLGVATGALLETKDAQEENERMSEKLLNVLVDVALNDINLCQRLFFLLRCFIGVLDGQASQTSDGIEAANSLNLLRYAQRRLSGRMFDKSESLEDKQCNKVYPTSKETSSTSNIRKFSQLDVAMSDSPMVECVRTPGAPVNRIRTGASSINLDPSDSGENTSNDNVSCQTPGSTITANSSEGTKKKNLLKSSSKIRQLLKGKSKASVKKVSDGPSLPPAGATRTLKPGSTFSFTNVFHKQTTSTSLNTISGECASPTASSPNSPQSPQSPQTPPVTLVSLSLSQKFDNLAWILRQIDTTCSAIEKNLIKSIPQKMADLALRPWSATKESALASITQNFQADLRALNTDPAHFPILNPVNSMEELTSVDADECFILPSAHFPMLLCFHSNVSPASLMDSKPMVSESRFNTLYRTKVEVLRLSSTVPLSQKAHGSGGAYVVQGAVGGVVQESGASELYISPKRSSKREVISHRWTKSNTLLFETSSNSGYPKTLSLKISTVSRNNVDSRDDVNATDDEMGCAFVDLTPVWKHMEQTSSHSSISSGARVFLFEDTDELFDQHGVAHRNNDEETVEIQIKVSVEVVSPKLHPQKRLLLYKHGDDLRQELLAIQFIERCNLILIASGLDLKLKTFRCLPVGAQKGFIEWVSGTVPLSQLCQCTCSSGSNVDVGSRQSSLSKESTNLDDSHHSSPAAAEAIESIDNQVQGRKWCKYQALRGLCQKSNGSVIDNPIQDFLRSAAFDDTAPYYVKKDVMDAYVKSCAGYCVITYLLGVGDRHLDNILLHQNGHLLHCDFSFILGHDPKTYQPMRITEEMIRGFGGQESDNYAKFLSFTGAAFLTLRRHNNLHSLMSQIRNMVYSNMRDLSLAQPPTEAILAMRGRFRLDLNDDDALSFIEHVVEKSISSKMWRAVDVMHSWGKHF